jgi:K+-sensing histidine kinase KdpD
MLARLSKTLRGLGHEGLRAGSPPTYFCGKAPHLVLGYLLPTIIIVICYSSTFALLTSFTSALAATYFLFTPKFSFYVADLKHIAELGFFLMLATIASKAIGRPAGRHLPPRPRLETQDIPPQL